MAGYAGFVQLRECLVVDHDVSGADLVVTSPDFDVHCDPEVYPVGPGLQVDALVLGPVAQHVTGYQRHVHLGQHFLRL